MRSKRPKLRIFSLFQEVRMLEKLTISCDAIDSDFCKTNSAWWHRLTQFVAKVEDVPQFAISNISKFDAYSYREVTVAEVETLIP